MSSSQKCTVSSNMKRGRDKRQLEYNVKLSLQKVIFQYETTCVMKPHISKTIPSAPQPAPSDSPPIPTCSIYTYTANQGAMDNTTPSCRKLLVEENMTLRIERREHDNSLWILSKEQKFSIQCRINEYVELKGKCVMFRILVFDFDEVEHAEKFFNDLYKSEVARNIYAPNISLIHRLCLIYSSPEREQSWRFSNFGLIAILETPNKEYLLSLMNFDDGSLMHSLPLYGTTRFERNANRGVLNDAYFKVKWSEESQEKSYLLEFMNNEGEEVFKIYTVIWKKNTAKLLQRISFNHNHAPLPDNQFICNVYKIIKDKVTAKLNWWRIAKNQILKLNQIGGRLFVKVAKTLNIELNLARDMIDLEHKMCTVNLNRYRIKFPHQSQAHNFYVNRLCNEKGLKLVPLYMIGKKHKASVMCMMSTPSPDSEYVKAHIVSDLQGANRLLILKTHEKIELDVEINAQTLFEPRGNNQIRVQNGQQEFTLILVESERDLFLSQLIGIVNK